MIWRKKRQPKGEEGKSTSSFFSFATWFSKLKKKPTASTERSTVSRPKPLFSPPHILPPRSKSDRHVIPSDAPRRLSVGEEDSHLARSRTCRAPPLPRSARHYSAGGDLEFDFLESSRRRSDRGILKELNSDPDPHPTRSKPIESHRPIRSGRRSFSGKVRPRVRVCSPRIRRRATAGSPLERFAVVKSSSDPTRDFRESMVEMISEKGIQRPEELEGLLACYLSLNSDEHHDVIVKVFRQVWFDLNRQGFQAGLVRPEPGTRPDQGSGLA